jgi:hypothetical protein
MRRLVQRRMQGDDGSTLIETVVALVVFAVIMSGLAASLAVFAHNTALTKARSAATSLAQKQVETARSLGTTNLSVCTGGGSPATFPFKGTNYPVITSTATGCLPFQATKTSGGYSFAVKQYVLNLGTKTNTAGIPQTQKLLMVKLSWTAPTAGSYELDTVMNNNEAVAATPAQGIRINVNDSTGTLINISAAIWDYTIKDGTNTVVASGTTEDGSTGVLSLNPGTYTCSIVAEADAGQSYSPGTNPGMTVDATNDSITGTCTVTANTATDWTTTWNELSSCTSSGTKGSLAVTVTDSSGATVSGATVALTNVNGNSVPGNATTNASGVALFSGNVADDLYTYTISKTGYTTSTNLGPVCVAGTGTATATGSISGASTCPVVTTKGTVSVTVTDETGAVVSGAKVVLTNQTPGKGSPGSVNTNPSGVALFNNNVLGGSYTYTLSKTGYTSSGAEGPVCVTAATTNYISGLLPTAGSTGCASSGTKGTLSITVADQTGAGLNGVKVTLTNANGHGGVPGAKNTATVNGVDGVALFNNSAPADPYLFSITPPAGYTNPGTLGPVCVIAGQSVAATATLVGIMTSQIKVTNSDIQPTKTYNITITDSNGRATTNSVTINRTKNATVSFPSMPTDNYTLRVCVPIAATGNCDAINDPTAVYNWGAIGTTYLTSITDNKGGA